jgi:hypothetical protein
MGWTLFIVAVVFVVGVLLAFPLAIGILGILWGTLVGLDRFTNWCPGFRHLRRVHRKRLYRPGRIVTRFLVPDVRRDVEVVDASELDSGLLTVRTRTWNVLYESKGLSPLPPFGASRTVAIAHLWDWTGEPWGGAVPEADM